MLHTQAKKESTPDKFSPKNLNGDAAGTKMSGVGLREKIRESMMSNYYKHNFLPRKKKYRVAKKEVVSNVFPLSEIDVRRDKREAVLRMLPKNIKIPSSLTLSANPWNPHTVQKFKLNLKKSDKISTFKKSLKSLHFSHPAKSAEKLKNSSQGN